MTNLYDEAVLEAKQLRQAAEDNAVRTVVEAITPRVRRLIEAQILGEEIEDDNIFNLGEISDADFPVETDPNSDKTLGALPEGDDEEDSSGDVKKAPTGDSNKNNDKLLLNTESARALMRLKESAPIKSKNDFENRIQRIKNSLGFGNTLLESPLRRDEKSLDLLGRLCDKMLNELRILNGEQIGIAGVKSQELETLRKEITEMATRKKLTEMDLMMEFGLFEDDEEMDFGAGEGEGEKEEDLDVELTDDEGELEGGAEDVTVHITGLPSGVDLDALDFEVEGGSAEIEGDDLDAEMDFEVGDENAGDEELELDDDAVIEIDEGMLKRELMRMRKIAEGNAADPKSLAAFGGGKKSREPFVDSKDTDLNKQDAVGTVKVEGKTLQRLRNESRQNRALRKERAAFQKKITELTQQLQEQNLFNAKLLYVNRLVHTKSLNEKQLRSIVGSLDKAQTLREVKLLYKSFTESLNRKSGKQLSEAAQRSSGSSSRAARGGSSTASPTVDRWAQLAGLPNKD